MTILDLVKQLDTLKRDYKRQIDDLPKSYAGYDATKTQTLKNINGVLTWVSDTESGA